MKCLHFLLPRTLMARVFALLTVSMLIFLLTGFGLVIHLQINQQIEDAQDSASMLAELAAQAVEESAVIGDYDTVKRTLETMLVRSPFKSAAFIDLSGGIIRLQNTHQTHDYIPSWLEKEVSSRLFDVNRPIHVGGRDYGVMRLSFDQQQIASQLWKLIAQALVLVVVFLLLSLFLTWLMSRRWLGHLGKLQAYQAQVAAGSLQPRLQAADNAPAEIQEVMKVLDSATSSLRDQFGQRIDSLMNALIQHQNAMDEASIVCEADVTGQLIYVNDRFIESTGFSRAELLNMTVDQMGIPATDAQWRWTPHESVWSGEVTLYNRNGTQQWRHRTIVPIFDSARVIEKYICIDIDVTDRKLYELAIIKNVERQHIISELGQQALTDVDPDRFAFVIADAAIRGVGADFCLILDRDGSRSTLKLKAACGWPASIELSRFMADASILDSDTAGYGKAVSAGEVRMLANDIKTSSGVKVGAEILLSTASKPTGAFGIYFKDDKALSADELNFLQALTTIMSATCERSETRAHLTYLASYDSLTDLPNRRHLVEQLEGRITQAEIKNSTAAVMFIDLDRFKNVNDTMGHAAGDVLLRQVSRRLAQSAGQGDVVARLGGDEFAVVLQTGSQINAIETMAARLIKVLEEPIEINDQDVILSASIGIALYPDHGRNADELIMNADSAMYSAKASGRNTYQFYTREMNEHALRRVQIETLLRGALDRHEFMLLFQPKVDISSGAISGFEALLRWHNVQAGPVSPLEFIPILEDTGLISSVGEWVIRQVCTQLQHWKSEGVVLKPVAINLSARQLQQKNLPLLINTIFNEFEIEPSLIELELTESMLMSDPESIVGILDNIRSQGVRIAIDDFGTGYSSLAYLKRFPIDTLKIDRTFVKDLPDDTDDAAITKAVIALGHQLNLKVIAEGVETPEQLELLAQNGCDEFQGYYFSKPVEAEVCLKMLKG
jgi:diguanylate cyclase (GGDEF)-like protein/PAS domain S-box-containing protein